MASASKSTTLYNNNGYGFTLTASFNENSTSVANNTSNITCTATLTPSNAYWSTSYPSTLTIYWHDNRENYDRQVASISFNGLSSAYDVKSVSGTINVTHNDDGTLSGFAYAYFDKGSTTSAWAANSGGVATDWTVLTMIARASQPTISPSSTFNIGDTIIINTNRKSNLFTHTLTLSFGSYTYQIGTNITDSATLDTSTIASNLYQQTPNDYQKNGTITCITYNGTTQVGTTTTTFTAVVTDSYPTFTSQYQDINPTTIAITSNNQYIIRNNSNLQISIINASGTNYATLVRLYADVNGVTYEGVLNGTTGTIDIGTIDISSNINAKVGVVDSRGYGTEHELPITILDWVLPTAIINIQRVNNYYTETDINVDASYSSLNGLNTIFIKARYKKTTEGSYGSYVTLTDGVTSQLSLDNLYSWNVQVLLEDRIGSTTYNLFVDKGLPIIFFDRLNNSVGVECFPTKTNSLEVSGVDVANKYSTNEIVVGTWMNKPLYRKVITTNSIEPVGSNYLTIQHDISNFEALAGNGLKCIAKDENDVSFDFNNYSWFGSQNGTLHVLVDSTNINLIYLGSGIIYGVVEASFVLEYTKTTD